MYPMRPQLPAPAQQYGYPQQFTAQPAATSYPSYPAPINQGLGALVPQQATAMVPQLPMQYAPVMGMAEGGEVDAAEGPRVVTGQAIPPQGIEEMRRRFAASGGGKGAGMQQARPDGYNFAQTMRTAPSPEARMAALRQMRAGQAAGGGKGQRTQYGAPTQRSQMMDMLRAYSQRRD